MQSFPLSARPTPLAGVLTCWAAVALSACQGGGTSPAQDKPITVTLVTDLPRADVEPALAALEGGTPPLHVEVVWAKAPAAGADVFWSSIPGPALALVKSGQTQPHLPARPPALGDPTGAWNGAAGTGWMLLVAKGRTTPDYTPQTIEDFSNPRYRGLYVLPPEGGAVLHSLKIGLTEVWGAQHAGILFDLFSRNEPHFQASQADEVNALVRQRATIGLVTSDVAAAAVKAHPELVAIPPDQDDLGTLVVPSAVVVMATAPHKEAAFALVDRLVELPVVGRVVPKAGFKAMQVDVTHIELPPSEPASLPEPPSEPASLPELPSGAASSAAPSK